MRREACAGWRSGWWRNLALVILVVGCCVVAFSVMRRSPAVPNAGLVVEESRLNFGRVWEDPEFKWTLPIANPTVHTVEITGFQVSCVCMAIEPKSLVLSPGEQNVLQMTLNLRFGPDEKPVRDFSVQLVPRIKNVSLYQEGWTIAGKVRKTFDSVPKQVFFDDGSLIRGEAFPAKTVELRACTDLTGVLAECRPPLAAIMVMPAKRKNTFALSVTPNSDLPAGKLEFDIRLVGLAMQTKLPPAILRVHGNVLEQVEMIPSVLLFGHRSVGDRAEETVLLRSRTGRGYRVLGFESTVESIHVDRVDEPADSPPKFRISQTFLDIGQQSAAVSFRVLVDDGPEPISIAVPVRYCGLAKKTGDEMRVRLP